jgi:tRNA A37 threonylcarbamoyladenosine dehydratase
LHNLDPLYERSNLVFNPIAMQKLKQSHVLVAGTGGVGGFVVEALARAGVGQITLIDHDRVSASNKNRQIIALNSTIGQFKVEVLKNRILDINPHCIVNTRPVFYRPEDMSELLSEPFDYIVDAIDSLNCKVALVAEALSLKRKIVSSMGAGRRIDPTKILVSDISKTHTCGLARAMRQQLKRRGFSKGLKVVFSTELPLPPGPYEEIEGSRGRVVNGTASYMPGIFGLMLAGEVIKDLASDIR